MEELKKEYEQLYKKQLAENELQENHAIQVKTAVKSGTEEEFLEIAKAVFDEYMKMDALFLTTLYSGVINNPKEDYIQVNYEPFPDAKSVEEYIRQFCTEELTQQYYSMLFGGEHPLLKEVDGKLYTTFFDGIPTAYTQYDSISIIEASTLEIVYTIWPSSPSFEEQDTTYFVRTQWVEDHWEVVDCAPVMTKGSHDYYPETVYTRLDMGDYEVVLQDYTTKAGGPLAVAVVRGDEMETVKVLYEDWQRDPANVRLSKAGEIFGYDCFYVYDFGMFHSVLTDYYALVDGEIVQVAGSWGNDPEDSSFVKDLDGDGINELICNLFYSGDGRQSVRIYKRDGNQILCAGLEEESQKIDLSQLDFYEYVPGY